MAGLGLADAVAGYQQGVQWKQQQDLIAKQQAQQRAMEEANAESGSLLKEDQQQHVLRGGDPSAYRPSEDVLFKAAERRSAALLKRGLVDQFYENEARVAPMRLQARARAVQQYEADRDPVKFVMAVNQSMFNGKDVKGVEKVEGTAAAESADGLQGVEGQKPGVKVTFSDGSTQFIDPDAAAKGIKVGMLDPKQWALTEAQAAAKRLELEHRTKNRLQEIDAQGKSNIRVAEINADGRRDVAETKAEADVERTRIRGEFSKETAKIRGEFQALAAKNRGASGGGRTSDEVQRFKALELAARSHMDSIRKEMTSKEAMLKDAGASQRPKIEAAVAELKSQLDEARNAHTEILSSLQQPAAGLADAPAKAPSVPPDVARIRGTGNARNEAIGTGEAVQFDLGGRRGSFTPEGGLAAAAPKADPARSSPPKPAAAKPEAAKRPPEAPRNPDQRKANTVYSTPKGDLMWTGKGWKRVDG